MIDQDFLQYSILGNNLKQWLLAAGTVLLGFVLLRLLKHLASTRLARIASRTQTRWDDIIVEAINRTGFLLLVSVFFGSLFLDLPERMQTIFRAIVMIALLLQVGVWLTTITISVIEQYRKKAMAKNPAAATTINAIGFMGKIVIVM